MTEHAHADASAQFRKLIDEFLAAAAPPVEDVVNTKAYGEMLGQTLANLVALNRINSDVMDLAWRNLRIASRADIVSLHRQLARTEDKLEMVLEAVERLEDHMIQHRGAASNDDAAMQPSATSKR